MLCAGQVRKPVGPNMCPYNVHDNVIFLKSGVAMCKIKLEKLILKHVGKNITKSQSISSIPILTRQRRGG